MNIIMRRDYVLPDEVSIALTSLGEDPVGDEHAQLENSFMNERFMMSSRVYVTGDRRYIVLRDEDTRRDLPGAIELPAGTDELRAVDYARRCIGLPAQIDIVF